MARKTIALFILSLGLSLSAQVPVQLPLNGNLGTILGTPAPYASVRITLQSCPAPVTVTGYQVIVQTSVLIQADASGLVNSTVWANDQITCNGTTGGSQYARQLIVNGVPSGPTTCYQVLSSQGVWNLNTQQPVACGGSPPNPQDETYRNLVLTGYLQGTSGTFSGILSAGGFTNPAWSGDVGDCVTVAAGGVFAPLPCATNGVTQIVAGTNVTLSPSGGTGVVTVNASGGSGGVTQIIAGSNVTISPSGGTGAVTVSAAGGSGGLADPGANGFVFRSALNTTRAALLADLNTLQGGTALLAGNDLNDVGSATASLTNLFDNAGLASSPMIGTDSFGGVLAVSLGPGLTYTPGAGAGIVANVTATTVGSTFTNAGNYPLTFTGGGGLERQPLRRWSVFIRRLARSGRSP